MAGNLFGKLYRLSSFGESHGAAVGGVIDGCPAGIALSVEGIQQELNRRRPGQSDVSTPRYEADEVEILSGLFEGRTTGMPIAFIVWNKNQNSKDYTDLKELYRPVSYTQHIARVVGGAVAKQILAGYGIGIYAYTSQVGGICLPCSYREIDIEKRETNIVRCPDEETAKRMIGLIREVKEAGDSVGGVVSCLIRGVMPGLGEPVFDRFQARLAQAVMSINATKGFEYGTGFSAAGMRGSEHNDPFVIRDGQVRTETNRSGGIQGGVTNGEDIYFRVAFKPVATIMREQETVNRRGEEITFEAQGRHDPCVVPRAVPVVEAMAAMVVLDMLLESRTVR